MPNSEQVERRRRPSLAGLRGIKSKIGLWESTWKPQKENVKLPNGAATSVPNAVEGRHHNSSSPAREAASRQTGEATVQQEGSFSATSSAKYRLPLAAEAAAVGRRKLNAVLENGLEDRAPSSLLTEPELAQYTSLQLRETQPKGLERSNSDAGSAAIPANPAEEDWCIHKDLGKLLQHTQAFHLRTASKGPSTPIGDSPQLDRMEMTPSSVLWQSHATPYSVNGLAPMDISPMLSVPGTPAEYTQCSELPTEYLRFASNGLFSPGPEDESPPGSTGNVAGHRNIDSAEPPQSQESTPAPDGTPAAAEHEEGFDFHSLQTSLSCLDPKQESRSSGKAASEGGPAKLNYQDAAQEVVAGIAASSENGAKGHHDSMARASAAASQPVHVSGSVKEGEDFLQASSEDECDPPEWQPSFANEWLNLIDMTEPLPGPAKLSDVLEREVIDVDILQKASRVVEDLGLGTARATPTHALKVIGDLLQSYNATTSAEAAAVPGEAALKQQRLEAELDQANAKLCSLEAQLTECRIALEHEKGEREHSEAGAAAQRWALEKKLVKEKEKYAEQKEQFGILHREKYLPLKEYSASLSSQILQLEEALAEAKAEQEAQALAALELHAAFAERKAQTQAKEEALGASNEDGRCLAERIAVLEASLEESARELLSAQATAEEMQCLAASRLKEVEKLSDDKVKLYKMCDELLSAAESIQTP